jgi:two-component sensor histidine kinase
LLELSDRLRDLDDPDAIHQIASRLLGEHLGVNRCTFSDVDGESFTVQPGYANGVPPVPSGQHHISDFCARISHAICASEDVIVDDVAADPSIPPAELACCRAAQIGAYVWILSRRRGDVVGCFGVQTVSPRRWSEPEVELVRDVGERLAGAVARARAEAALRRSLAERETLVKEVHHRVKNNLEVIDSLLHLQADALPDAAVRAALCDTSNRVHAIAEIHRLLYGAADLNAVDMGAYVEALVHFLVEVSATDRRRITTVIAAQPLSLDLRRAVPLGLWLNELVTNALKHAFPGDRVGTVWIDLENQGESIEVRVRDDGVGAPTTPSRDTLGMQLVRILAQQLGGALHLDVSAGTAFRLRFPTRTDLVANEVHRRAPATASRSSR